MRAWQKIGQRVEPIGFRTLVFKRFKLPDGHEHEFTTYSQEGTRDVAIIALTPDNMVVIARQYRPGPEEIFDELPGGEVEVGEDLETAAQRELLEETGYSVASLDYLGPAHRDAYNNATAHYYWGEGATKTAEPTLEPSEFVEVDTITPAQLIDNARRGRMTDSPAVLMAYTRLQQLIDSK